MPGGKSMANIWHGEFPHENLSPTGYIGTLPVGSYPPERSRPLRYDRQLLGIDQRLYREHARAGNCCSMSNPRGGMRETSINASDPVAIPRKVMKGGSYLCAPNYCHRYRPAARIGPAYRHCDLSSGVSLCRAAQSVSDSEAQHMV